MVASKSWTWHQRCWSSLARAAAVHAATPVVGAVDAVAHSLMEQCSAPNGGNCSGDTPWWLGEFLFFVDVGGFGRAVRAYNAYLALHTGVYTTFLLRVKSISLVSNIEIV
jgi:hypothetical protein